ncbi:MAG: methylhydantoinase [Candidatus Electrothrix sp. ATG1]|nr:methylhydantoinase [Candidatus Electrothrix sp. ATG1]MCI5207219.1 methylhydantoinase [Candidatus Electrothrix sp. ATG2]
MLTFEWDESSECLEIHLNNRGLQMLANQIKQLENLAGNEHLHLMTEDWGGSELSNEKQNKKSNIINHVKIVRWADE